MRRNQGKVSMQVLICPVPSVAKIAMSRERFCGDGEVEALDLKDSKLPAEVKPDEGSLKQKGKLKRRKLRSKKKNCKLQYPRERHT